MTKTTAAPTAAKPSAARPSRAAPVAPPPAEQVETSTAATGGDYLKKKSKVPVNFSADAEEHQAIKVWCAEHGYKMTQVYTEGAKLFIQSKQATAK